MKISNLLVIIAVFVTFATLLTYDLFVRSVYASGVYKIPYYNYKTLSYTGFESIDVSSSTVANVKIIPGAFSVRIDPDARDYVLVSQLGKKLSIAVKFPGNYLGNGDDYTLVISCPVLRELSANATYEVGTRVVTDTTVVDHWRVRNILVEGFREDSLSIFQDYGSSVILKNNTISSVDAKIGKSPDSGSDLTLDTGNHFHYCQVMAENRSRLILENTRIDSLDYTIGDRARVIVAGNAQHLLKAKYSVK